MIVRVGIPASFRRFAAIARELAAPVLISANALRRARRPGFMLPRASTFAGLDVALDSAGFVAMFRYGGYPWSVAEYVRLAAAGPWRWWASMDYCCEPEIARDRAEVRRRQVETVARLAECRAEAERVGASLPMPVLQGWTPDDYARCAELVGELPPLVGVGSVCRRHLGGPDGLLPVVERLDRVLERGVGLHLFGVKGRAIELLRGHPRVASVDSMAWDYAARRELREVGATVERRGEKLRGWYADQLAALGRPGWALQADLPLDAAERAA